MAALKESKENIDKKNDNLFKACKEGLLSLAIELVFKAAKLEHRAGDEGYTPLLVAAEEGHAPIVAMLCDRGADLKARSCRRDRTALMISAMNGKLDVVSTLVDRGSSIDDVDKSGGTALTLAAMRGHLGVVKYLFERGANIRHTDQEGADALWGLAGSDSLELITFLVDNGCNVNAVASRQIAGQSRRSVFLRACEGSSVEVVAFLKERGADIHAVDENGSNAAHLALCENTRQMFEYLAGQGVDVTAETDQGTNCLMLAAKSGFLDIVKKLHEEYGIDVNHQNNDGSNALMWAASGLSEHEDEETFKAIVLYIVEKGADIHAVDKDGENALMSAGRFCNESVFAALLDLGADVNAKKNDSKTCAMVVVNDVIFTDTTYFLGESSEIFKMLADKGADFDVVDDDGRNFLHYASSQGQSKTCKWAIEWGMKPSVCDYEGYNGLMLAGNVGVAEVFLDNGLDVELVNHHNRSAFLLACARGLTDVAKLLKEHGARTDGLDTWGMNALHLAAYNDELNKTAEWLILQGMDPNVEDEDGHTAISHYGSFVGADPDRTWPKPLTPEVKAERAGRLVKARAEYLELQRREECYQRRKAALKFLQGSGFMPSAAQREEQRAEQQQVDTFAKLQAIDRSTKEANRKYLHEEVFGHEGLRRKIVGML